MSNDKKDPATENRRTVTTSTTPGGASRPGWQAHLRDSHQDGRPAKRVSQLDGLENHVYRKC
jgi:hypothetical protein